MPVVIRKLRGVLRRDVRPSSAVVQGAFIMWGKNNLALWLMMYARGYGWQRGGMRTLHSGRFPLTGASLLANYMVRPDACLPPPGIVQGGKRMLKGFLVVRWDP